MIAINPQYLNLWRLFSGRLFKIPEYQRAYSWTTKERKDLFGDLKASHDKGSDAGHFMAAIVCLRRNKQILGTDEYQVYDVVDGQQRLTTLIILLKAITLRANKKDKSEKKLLEELEDILVKPDSDELLLLQTNHDSSHHFVSYLRKGKAKDASSAKTLADREILSAVEECIEFVDLWREEDRSLPSLVALLKNRLFFLLHEINDEESVYTVFEVLNSRGLEVSWLDRLKSILMGAAFEIRGKSRDTVIHELHVIWRDIYSVIGLRQGMNAEALRFAATLREEFPPSRPLGEEASVNLLRQVNGNAKQVRDVAQWLLRVTQACDDVSKDPRINAVTRIVQARLLAASIYLRDDLPKKTREELLRKWEAVTFRIYGMCRKDSRVKVGDYVRLSWRVTNEGLKAGQILKEIGALGEDYPINDAVESLESTDCYDGWEDELRYFMFRYEEFLSKNRGQKFSNEQWARIWEVSPSNSIEHIHPQSSPHLVQHRHRLGNLVILPPRLNSSLQDRKPVDKVDEYRDTGLLVAQDVANQIANSGKWNSMTIDARERQLLDWAESEWG